MKRFRPTWEIAIFRNRVRLRNPDSGSVAERTAVRPFSTATALIADRECLEEEIKQMARQLPKPTLFIIPDVRVTEIEGTLTPVEREALQAALDNAGFARSFLPDR